MVRVAVAQIDPTIGEKPANLAVINRCIDEVAQQGAQLVVFPECAVSGYVYGSLDEALQVAEPIPGPATAAIAEMTARRGVYAVVGMLERVEDRCYNAAILSGPNGVEAVYRKTHTLCLGVDRFATPGDIPFQVHQLPFARVGILICYDLRFPEPARMLFLEGAQIIALPTNWPRSSTIQPDVFTRSRAAENRVFLLAADRAGTERGATFLGRSQIVSPDGVVLAEAPMEGAHILIQDIDPAEADQKHVVLQPGEHEMDCLADRRPDLYRNVAPIHA
jgi:predicted amidohydrolase